MDSTKARIAAKLEEAFAEQGFAEPGVDDLRTAAGVSLRTLYKYFPSRSDMVIGALNNRHARYVAFLFADLPEDPEAALDTVFDRVGEWMRTRSPTGCMFHGAVAAHPRNEALAEMLGRNKKDIAARMAEAGDLPEREDELLLLHEGLTQGFTLMRERAVECAKALAKRLRTD
ncbi:TetR/AcrR family transcriptional regulator [Dichotomicrobium thermohalophilum]|uniref:TetR family transcriptional regulator n=1 Tax=Dichotomicrobium thermohalophilum TaxID=933063 RepID=A0A397Q2E4_9HYPH|nr:TetR/AcrR family transcriptional regulator [Dichotomicrobium thermohalophilum]RIA55228.1 TetR family transcriptional regulator [Dichotomicrobium thermohalophilum]